MKNVILFSMLAVLCISTASCTHATAPDSPTASVDAPVKRFLHFYFHDYQGSLAEASQLPELATFVTPGLLDLFRAALRG